MSDKQSSCGPCGSAKCFKTVFVTIVVISLFSLLVYTMWTNFFAYLASASTSFFPVQEYTDEVVMSTVGDGNSWMFTMTDSEPVFGEANIMFSETSCSLDQHQHVLKARQACAIESAARTNPTHKIYLSHSCVSDGDIANTPAYVKQLFEYPNVKFFYENVTTLVEETVVEEWWSTNPMTKSSWPISHTSDLTRLVLLYKYGGIYMDLDVVVVRDFTGMENFVGAELTEFLAGGLMGFRADGVGHEVVGDFLIEIKDTFKGDNWGHNGPALIQRVLCRRCNVTRVPDMTPERCDGVRIIPPEVFYPIYGTVFERLFQPDNEKLAFFSRLQRPDSDIKSVHLWNALSSNTVVNVGSDQIYGLLAGMYCPRVYANCGETF